MPTSSPISARRQHAELVALGICEHDPRHGALSDVAERRTERAQPGSISPRGRRPGTGRRRVEAVLHDLGARSPRCSSSTGLAPSGVATPRSRTPANTGQPVAADQKVGTSSRGRGVEDDSGDRSSVLVVLAGLEHTQFVALGIGKHNPRHVALSDVDLDRAEFAQPRRRHRPGRAARPIQGRGGPGSCPTSVPARARRPGGASSGSPSGGSTATSSAVSIAICHPVTTDQNWARRIGSRESITTQSSRVVTQRAYGRLVNRIRGFRRGSHAVAV